MTVVPEALSHDHRFRALANVFEILKFDVARAFFRRVTLQIIAVMALIEAIFLAERFTIVFGEGLEKNANMLDISLILGCTRCRA